METIQEVSDMVESDAITLVKQLRNLTKKSCLLIITKTNKIVSNIKLECND